MNPEVLHLELTELRKERDSLRVELASARKDVARLLEERRGLARGVRRVLDQVVGRAPVEKEPVQAPGPFPLHPGVDR